MTVIVLADSSARSEEGHHLEYMRRIAAAADLPAMLFVNRSFLGGQQPGVRPTFRFATFERGRYWRGSRRPDPPPGNNNRATPSRGRLIAARVERLHTRALPRLGHVRWLSRRIFSTEQARAFAADLRDSELHNYQVDQLIISSSNEREWAGLISWIESDPASRGFSIPVTVLLRRPISEVTSVRDALPECLAAIGRLSVLFELSKRVRLVADTVALQVHYEGLLRGQRVELAPVPSFGSVSSTHVTTTQPGAAPGRRKETTLAARVAVGHGDLGAADLIDSLPAPKPGLDSKSYQDWLAGHSPLLLAYDPWRYRFRSSGVNVEAITQRCVTVVPTGTSMSREIMSRTAWPADARTGHLLVGRRGQAIVCTTPEEGPALVRLSYRGARGHVLLESRFSWTRASDVVWHDLGRDDGVDGFVLPAGVHGRLRLQVLGGGERTGDVSVDVVPLRRVDVPGLAFRPSLLTSTWAVASTDVAHGDSWMRWSEVHDPHLTWERLRTGERAHG